MDTGTRTLLSLQATQMETAAHSLMEQARALGEAVARDNDPHHGRTLSAHRAYTVMRPVGRVATKASGIAKVEIRDGADGAVLMSSSAPGRAFPGT